MMAWEITVSSKALLTLIFLTTCLMAWAVPMPPKDNTLQYDLRFHSMKTQTNYMANHLVFHTSPFPWLQTKWASRVAFTHEQWQRMDYQGEVSYRPFRFLALNLRLSHALFPYNRTAMTTALLESGFDLPIFRKLTLFGSFGWYYRLYYLSQYTVVPLIYDSDITDHSPALKLGFTVHPIQRLTTTLHIATLDEIDLFRLNNPYVQTTLGYSWSHSLLLKAYVRYRLLLGFGRMDELMFGMSFHHKI